jgi:membrane fusion protein (multidrug efflux system)
MADGPAKADHPDDDAGGSSSNGIKDERSYRATVDPRLNEKGGDDKKDVSDKEGGGDKKGDDKDKPKKGLLQRPILLVSMATVLLLALLFGVIFWLHSRDFESTDDAFVDAHIVRLAPQITGRVTKVLVNDNQLVGPNQPLVTIDSADVSTKVAQAQAQKSQAQAQVDNARVQIAVNQASYQQSLADARAARRLPRRGGRPGALHLGGRPPHLAGAVGGCSRQLPEDRPGPV